MIHNNIDTETQADIQIPGKIDDFFNKFNMATSLHRCGIRKQLGYPARNLKTIKEMGKERVSLFALDKIRYKNLLVINEVYRQQKWMYD